MLIVRYLRSLQIAVVWIMVYGVLGYGVWGMVDGVWGIDVWLMGYGSLNNLDKNRKNHNILEKCFAVRDNYCVFAKKAVILQRDFVRAASSLTETSSRARVFTCDEER